MTENIKRLELPEIDTILIDEREFINFESINKLKIFRGDLENFYRLKNINSLERIKFTDLYLYEGKRNIIKKVLLKIIQIESLKEIYIDFKHHSIENDVKNLDLDNKNYSVRKLTIKVEEVDELDLNEIQNIFPNLTDFVVINKNCRHRIRCGNDPTLKMPRNICEKDIIITENPESKINRLKIHFLYGEFFYSLKFNCAPFNKIEYFDLCIESTNIDLIPFFQKECDIIFESLKSFKFTLYIDYLLIFSRKYDLIKNFYNNIDKMSNLREFNFSYKSTEISKDFFIKFVEKIFNLKYIKNIEIKINEDDNIYSRDELIKLFPKINFHKFDKIIIYSFEK